MDSSPQRRSNDGQQEAKQQLPRYKSWSTEDISIVGQEWGRFYPLNLEDQDTIDAITSQIIDPLTNGMIDEAAAKAIWINLSKKQRSNDGKPATVDDMTRPPAANAPKPAPSQQSTSRPIPDSDSRGQHASTHDKSHGESQETAKTVPGPPSSSQGSSAAASDSTEQQSKPAPVAKAPTSDNALTTQDKSERTPDISEKTLEGADVAPPSNTTEEIVEAAPPEPIKPQWKNIDPDSSDPDFVENDVHQVEQLDKTWRIIAASVRGKSHAHAGTFRDDSYSYGMVDDWNIVVVSDGAGSSKLSRVASRIACDVSVQKLKELLAGTRLECRNADPESDELRSELEQKMRGPLVESAGAAQAAVLLESNRRKPDGITANDMYATLLVMLHTRHCDRDVVASIQIGDGAIGVFHGEGECSVLGDADHGEFTGETRFLITPGIEDEFQGRAKVTIFKTKVQCVAVMSDGVSDDFFPEKKQLIQLFNGDPINIEGMTASGSEAEPMSGVLKNVVGQHDNGESLARWIKYEKRGSFDDRTLVLLCRGASS